MIVARNMTDEEKKGYKEVSWDDREACGFYMVRFCPHDLFVNTRSDLGMCRAANGLSDLIVWVLFPSTF